MADDIITSSPSTIDAILDSPLLYLGIGAIVLGGAGWLYWKYGKPQVIEGTTTETTTTTAPVKSNSSSSSSTPAKSSSSPSSGGKDYTNVSDTTVYADAPHSFNGLTIGDAAKVKSGATVTRMDKALNEMGTTKLTSSDTNLGTIWHLFPSSVIVRASSGYGYPFYKVALSDMDNFFSLSSLNPLAALGIPSLAEGRYLGADGFGGYEHLPAEGRVDAKLHDAIRKLTNQYMANGSIKYGIHGIGDYNLPDKSGNWSNVGIRIDVLTDADIAIAKKNLPAQVDGFKLYFFQRGMAQAQ